MSEVHSPPVSFDDATDQLVAAVIVFLQAGDQAGLPPMAVQASFMVAFQRAMETAANAG